MLEQYISEVRTDLPLYIDGEFPRLHTTGQDNGACYFSWDRHPESLYTIDFEDIPIAEETIDVFALLIEMHCISIADMNLLIAQYKQNCPSKEILCIDDFFRNTLFDDFNRVIKQHPLGMFSTAGIWIPQFFNILSKKGAIPSQMHSNFLQEFRDLYNIRSTLSFQAMRDEGASAQSKQIENERGVMALRLQYLASLFQEFSKRNAYNGSSEIHDIAEACRQDIVFESLRLNSNMLQRMHAIGANKASVLVPIDLDPHSLRIKQIVNDHPRDSGMRIVMHGLFPNYI